MLVCAMVSLTVRVKELHQRFNLNQAYWLYTPPAVGAIAFICKSSLNRNIIVLAKTDHLPSLLKSDG